jgi:drug/metabolite transporter (DMT)-like permease
MKNQQVKTYLALAAMYLIWGSTYLGIAVALESLPPLLLAGGRFLAGSSVLFIIFKIRGVPFPSLLEWRNAAIVGILMLGTGVGAVTWAEQWVASGLAAVTIATVPLWALIFSMIWKERPTRYEWLALLVGFMGVLLLNMEGNLRGNPLAAGVLILAAASWALGSNLSKHLKLPEGGMGFAAEMLMGGTFLVLAGLIRGENLSEAITTRSLLAWVYLVVFGSLIAFSSYMYLLKTTRVSIATSYAYVNPVVALLLGIVVADEPITYLGIFATFVIAGSVLILSYARHKTQPESQPAAAVSALEAE